MKPSVARLVLALSGCAIVLSGCAQKQTAMATQHAAAAVKKVVTAPSGQRLPRPDHVIIIVEENHSRSGIIGNREAPYMNEMAARGAVFTQSYAITHPSAPNYSALFSGETNTNGDGCPAAGIDKTAPNLGSELIAVHYTFVGYSETMPRAGYEGCGYGFGHASYARKHNPWVNFSNVPPESNQPLDALPPYERLPTVSFIVPNQAHDMHSSSIEDADDWLRARMKPLIDWAMTHNSLVILTWDEDDRGENNRIPTILLGPMVKPGTYGIRIDHYSVLRTIEDMYGLPHAGHSSEARTITECWH
ncbi:MAG: alkaline phosphatase family protein [Candidatus Eremiobacter antarcticus]